MKYIKKSDNFPFPECILVKELMQSKNTGRFGLSKHYYDSNIREMVA